MSGLLWIVLGFAGALTIIGLHGRMASFMAQKPADYAGTVPQLDLRDHLNGTLRCEGIIYGPLGRVTSRFSADFVASWEGNRGVIAEHFTYDSGNTQDREWRLEVGNDGTVRAEADDVVGTGQGRLSGSALRLTYRIRLTREAGGHVLDTTDWMYLTPSGTIVNRSQFRKFGIKVGELVATLQRVDAA